jgi:hypothetical protein
MRIERTKENSTIEIRFDNEVISVENAFVGGRMAECGGTMGFYGGILDIGEMGVSLMCLLRGAIKTMHEECGLSFHQAEKIILCCLTEAFRKETEEKQNESIQKELHSIVSRFMDNQNRP